ncbi:hypothetical protein FQZ97_944080 [compost metagenome]
MNALGEWFEGQVALVATGPQRLDLRSITKDVGRAHQHPVAVTDRRQRRLGILDTGDMHQPGQLGEEFLFTSQMMVKGVMHQAKHIQPANALDRFHRRALAAQRALFETQGFNEPVDAKGAQDRRQFTEGRTQPRRAFSLAARVGAVVERAHHQALGTAFASVIGQPHGLGAALFVPHVKGVQGVDRQHLDAARLAQLAHPGRRHAVFDLDTLQIVADLDGVGFQRQGQVDESGQ